MTIEELQATGWIVFEAVCGSKAYGLDTPESDTDIHGVFVAPLEYLADPLHKDFLESEGKDTVYWEIGKFMEMLRKGNPGALELLHSPPQCVLQQDAAVVRLLEPFGQFVTCACKDTFAKYAADQVKKARGLNKKIVNPMDGKRKSLLEFCHLLVDGKSVPLLRKIPREFHKHYGLAAVDHVPNTYAVYHNSCAPSWSQGFVRDEDTATEVCLSSVPGGIAPCHYLYCNKDAYAMHCRKYKEYKEWEKERNDARYQGTMRHGQGYDAKNMVHTIRLLQMALEIVQGYGVKVDRSADRDYLLSVKRGEHSYESLLDYAAGLSDKIEQAGLGKLPSPIACARINSILKCIRMQRWQSGWGLA